LQKLPKKLGRTCHNHQDKKREGDRKGEDIEDIVRGREYF